MKRACFLILAAAMAAANPGSGRVLPNSGVDPALIPSRSTAQFSAPSGGLKLNLSFIRDEPSVAGFSRTER